MAAIAHLTPHARQVHVRPTLRLVRNVPRPSDAVYRRRRLGAVVVLSALLLAVGGIVLALSHVGTTEGAPVGVRAGATSGSPFAEPAALDASRASPLAGSIYVVQPGDTLWSIARKRQPTGDVRAEVDRLADLNGTAALQAGQRLRLTSAPGS
jgi:LysM repeat protein